MRRIKFLEIKSELGARKYGAGLGTGAVKIAALNAKSMLFQCADFEKIKSENYLLFQGKTGSPHAHYIEGMLILYNRVAEAVCNAVEANYFPLILSGDHATAGATIAGLKMADRNMRLGVVWVDAHADIHSPYTSESGNMHGMPMSTALADDNIECRRNDICSDTKIKWEALKNIGGFSPKVYPQDVVYIALRSYEKEEEGLIKRLGIRVISVEELRKNGAIDTAKEIFDYLKTCNSIYISFDIDSLDNSIVPGTGTPEPDGLTEDEATKLLTTLVQNNKVNCLELTEVNPTLDTKNKTADLAFRIINKCITSMKE